MTVTALLAALSYFICYGGNWLLGQCMIERPIVVGAVTGLLLGDLPTGLIMGASLEAIFMGSVNIGGQISAEPAAATVFAVTFATMQTVDANAALAIAVPIGILSAFVSMFINNIAFNWFVPFIDKYATLQTKLDSLDNDRAITFINFGAWLLRFTIFSVLMFIGVYLGQGPVQTFVNSIPAVVMNGLTVAGKFMPAVGFAILMKMLWSKELAIYYFLGFILVTYMELPLVAVSAIGIIIVLAVSSRDLQFIKMQQNAAVGQIAEDYTDDVEDFLS